MNEFTILRHPYTDRSIPRLGKVLPKVDQLFKSYEKFFENNPIEIERLISTDGKVVEFKLNDFDPNHFFETLSEEVSDIFNSLRSALDHWAFGLARVKLDPPAKRKRISFPIFDTVEKFEERRRTLEQDFPSEAVDLFFRHQPFSILQGKPQPSDDYGKEAVVSYLQLLCDINNQDKHQEPIAGIYGILGGGPELDESLGDLNGPGMPTGPIRFSTMGSNRLTAGMSLGRVESQTPWPLDPPVGFSLDHTAALILDDGYYRFIHSIEGCLNCVMGIVAEMSELLRLLSPVSDSFYGE